MKASTGCDQSPRQASAPYFEEAEGEELEEALNENATGLLWRLLTIETKVLEGQASWKLRNY